MTLPEEPKDKWGKTSSQICAELLRERGVVEYVYVFGAREGRILPSGIEDECGMILTKDGRVFAYCLEWDPEKKAPNGSKGWYTLGENRFYEYGGKKTPHFQEIHPGDESYPKPDDSSFLAAKRKLGLA